MLGKCQKKVRNLRESGIFFRVLSPQHCSFMVLSLVTIQKYMFSWCVEYRGAQCMGTAVGAHLSMKSEISLSLQLRISLRVRELKGCEQKSCRYG